MSKESLLDILCLHLLLEQTCESKQSSSLLQPGMQLSPSQTSPFLQSPSVRQTGLHKPFSQISLEKQLLLDEHIGRHDPLSQKYPSPQSLLEEQILGSRTHPTSGVGLGMVFSGQEHWGSKLKSHF